MQHFLSRIYYPLHPPERLQGAEKVPSRSLVPSFPRSLVVVAVAVAARDRDLARLFRG